MKKIIWLLIILLLIVTLGMIVLYGASGHSVNIENTETLKYLFLIVLYPSTSIILMLYITKKSVLLKKFAIGFLSFTLLSFLYLFYEIFEVEMGDYSGLIPIGILIIVMLLEIRVLYHLLKQ